MIARRIRVARSGRARRCSHSCTVLVEKPYLRAKAAWLSRCRCLIAFTSTSSGATTRASFNILAVMTGWPSSMACRRISASVAAFTFAQSALLLIRRICLRLLRTIAISLSPTCRPRRDDSPGLPTPSIDDGEDFAVPGLADRDNPHLAIISPAVHHLEDRAPKDGRRVGEGKAAPADVLCVLRGIPLEHIRDYRIVQRPPDQLRRVGPAHFRAALRRRIASVGEERRLTLLRRPLAKRREGRKAPRHADAASQDRAPRPSPGEPGHCPGARRPSLRRPGRAAQGLS